tara:strand:- start:297 stop:710 length:414 start_codon:yes stop_codon:yes gene_type:complete
MKEKLKCVLLIDDDEANNFLNKRIIEKMDFTEHIKVAKNGNIALDLIKKGIKMEHCMPKLIFLDLNMPVMDGWEFLEEYNKLEFGLKQIIKIVILTTSLNPEERTKAENIKEVSGFINKPLRESFVKQILQEHFSMD